MYEDVHIKNRKKAHKKPVAGIVLARIKAQGRGRIWIYEDFIDLKFSLVAMALSRLRKKGILRRIRPGIYYYPKKTVLGESSPNPEAVLESILRKKHIRKMGTGMDVLNKLKITDQVSGVYVISVDERLFISNISGIKVKIFRRPLRDQKGINEEERAILDVCRSIRRIPNTSPATVIERIKALVISGKLNINRLMIFARFEPPRVRALIGSIADDLVRVNIKIHKFAIEGLKNSLNPLTYYKLGEEVKYSLNSAAVWHII